MSDQPTGSTTLWFTLAIVALVVVRFLARELRDRKIPINRVWIVPGVMFLLCAYLFATTLQIESDLLLEVLIGSIAGIAVGAAVGLAVDRFTTLRLSSDGKAMIVRGSMITVGIWIGALLLRLLGRFVAAKFSTHSLGMMMVLNTSFVFVIAIVRLRYVQRFKALQSAPAAPAVSFS
jgi:hypothetical protein